MVSIATAHPHDAEFFGLLDKDATDEEIAVWLQHAIAEAEKERGQMAAFLHRALGD